MRGHYNSSARDKRSLTWWLEYSGQTRAGFLIRHLFRVTKFGPNFTNVLSNLPHSMLSRCVAGLAGYYVPMGKFKSVVNSRWQRWEFGTVEALLVTEFFIMICNECSPPVVDDIGVIDTQTIA